MAGFASRTKVDWSVGPEALVSHARGGRRPRPGAAPERRNRRSRGGAAVSDDLATNRRAAVIVPRPPRSSAEELHQPVAAPQDARAARHAAAASATTGSTHTRGSPSRPRWFRGSATCTSARRSASGESRMTRRSSVRGWSESEGWLTTSRRYGRTPETEAAVHPADAREAEELLEPSSIDAVITSPPYPNEKDYHADHSTRERAARLHPKQAGAARPEAGPRPVQYAQRLQGRTPTMSSSRGTKAFSASRGASSNAVSSWARRQGSNGQYARVTKLYFGGMVRHLAGLRSRLRPGARLAYVVGDQASYLRGDDPDRKAPRRTCPKPRLRVDRHRPVPDPDCHRQQAAVAGRGRAAPLAGYPRLRSARAMTRTALIVGAGIGGLSAAISLRKAGWNVRVFECAASVRELGFALLVAPNAMAALRELGVADVVLARGLAPTRGEARRMDGTILKRGGLSPAGGDGRPDGGGVALGPARRLAGGGRGGDGHARLRGDRILGGGRPRQPEDRGRGTSPRATCWSVRTAPGP